MLRPTAIWELVDITTTYTDKTGGVYTNSNITFLSNANNDIYIGLERRYIGLYADLSTVGSYSSMLWKYYGGASWKSLSLIDSYSFGESKYIRWELPSDWSKTAFSTSFPESLGGTDVPPDYVERYWIKISASTVITAAVISKIRLIPFVQYTTAQDVSQLCQFKKDFGSDTKPTDVTVENIIRRAEDRIDYRTHKSWRFNAVTESTDPKLVDINRYGFYLRHKNFMKVYSVQIWNGSTWETMTEGRTGDYIVNYNVGMIYLTRTFTLPAVYGISGRFAQYDFGEFKQSIQVDYVYGRDSETDSEFYIVSDIATKMAAIDVLRHHDYSQLIAGGSDRASIDSKIMNMENEVEQRIDEITGIILA